MKNPVKTKKRNLKKIQKRKRKTKKNHQNINNLKKITRRNTPDPSLPDLLVLPPRQKIHHLHRGAIVTLPNQFKRKRKRIIIKNQTPAQDLGPGPFQNQRLKNRTLTL